MCVCVCVCVPAWFGRVDVIERSTTLLAVLTLKETFESSEACEVMVLSPAHLPSSFSHIFALWGDGNITSLTSVFKCVCVCVCGA